MFNLGGNDKEKLKENMEEIKDLVNSQEKGSSQGPQELMNGGQSPQQQENENRQPSNPDQGADSQPDNDPQLNPQEGMDNELPSDSQDMGQEMNDLQNAINNQGTAQETDRPDMEQKNNTQPQNNSLDSGLDSSGSEFNSSRGLGEDNLNNSDSSSRDSGSSLSGFQSDQRPDLSEESDKPDSDGDTLFLEVDEFNRVQEMVDEMKYLSREMNDLMENLEGGVEEDRRIESEAQDVIDEFSQRREHIESSIN